MKFYNTIEIVLIIIQEYFVHVMGFPWPAPDIAILIHLNKKFQVKCIYTHTGIKLIQYYSKFSNMFHCCILSNWNLLAVRVFYLHIFTREKKPQPIVFCFTQTTLLLLSSVVWSTVHCRFHSFFFLLYKFQYVNKNVREILYRGIKIMDFVSYCRALGTL